MYLIKKYKVDARTKGKVIIISNLAYYILHSVLKHCVLHSVQKSKQPVHIAATHGHEELMFLLIHQYGVDPCAKSEVITNIYNILVVCANYALCCI